MCFDCRHGLYRPKEEEQFFRKNSFGRCINSIVYSYAQTIPIFQHPQPSKSYICVCILNSDYHFFIQYNVIAMFMYELIHETVVRFGFSFIHASSLFPWNISPMILLNQWYLDYDFMPFLAYSWSSVFPLPNRFSVIDWGSTSMGFFILFFQLSLADYPFLFSWNSSLH